MRYYATVWCAAIFFGWLFVRGALNADYTRLIEEERFTDRIESFVGSFYREAMPRDYPLPYFFASLILAGLWWYEKDTNGLLYRSKPEDPLNIRDKLK